MRRPPAGCCRSSCSRPMRSGWRSRWTRIVLLLAAGFVTLGVVGSEPGRSPVWALGSGLVLGCDALLNYAVAWLGVSVVAVYFVRRRPLLNVFTGVGALVPLAPVLDRRLHLDRRAVRSAGRLLGTRRAAPFVAAVGVPRPAAAADRLRPADHPGVAAAAPDAGLAVRRRSRSRRGLRHPVRAVPRRGRTLLARLLPVPAHPRGRPAVRPPQQGGIDAGPVPFWPVAVGAVGAIVIEAVLRTTW